MKSRPRITRPTQTTAEREQLKRTAHHEAGHACALIRLKCRFTTVRLIEGGALLGQVANPDNRDLLALAVACLAGPCAQQRLLGTEKFESGDGDDLEAAHRVMCAIGLGGVPPLKSPVPFTRILIERNWSDVERIAAELLVTKILSYDDVVELIEGD